MGGENGNDRNQSAAEFAAEQAGITNVPDFVSEQVSGMRNVFSDSAGLPPFTTDLIKMLDKENPERTPHGDETDRDYWIYVGRRDFLNEMKRREKEIKENT